MQERRREKKNRIEEEGTQNERKMRTEMLNYSYIGERLES